MIESVASERVYNKKSGCKEGTRIELKRSIAYSINDVVRDQASDRLSARNCRSQPAAKLDRRHNNTQSLLEKTRWSEVCWWWQQYSLRLVFFCLSLLLTSALVASVDTDGSKSVENSLLGMLGGTDSLEFDFLSSVADGENITDDLVSGGSGFELLGGGVVDLTLLWLVFASGEENEFALVGAESCDVHLQLLLTGACSSVINGDSDTSGEGGAQSGALQLSKSKSSSEADLTSVLAGG